MFWKKGDKLFLTPLGGVAGYVGHNCFYISSGNYAVVIDCGIKPQTHEEGSQSGGAWRDSPPRLDILDEVKRNTIGVMSHAHLDHIGAAAELIHRNIPVYISQESKFFAARYSEAMGIPRDAKFYTFSRNKPLRNGNLEISFIPVQHSIPGTHAVLVRSGGKSILYLADFKLNGMRETSQESLNIFREIRDKAGRINCLVMDALNTDIDGFTPPEHLVIDSIENIIRKDRGRIFITFFSSNIRRMAGILNAARANYLTVGISGRGMSASYEQLMKRRSYKYGDIILIGGSQGEENSGLVKLAQGEHQFLRLNRRDTVIFSSRHIPGNEKAIKTLLENLRSQGARIILHQGEGGKLNLPFETREQFLHVSGHEQRGGLMEVKEILEPEIIVPFHAPEDRYKPFEEFVGGKETKRLKMGETLRI